MNGLMKVAAPLLGIGAACAICCAVPVSSILLAGLGAGVIGAQTLGWVAGAAALVATGGILWLRARAVAKSAACKAVAGGCGSGTSCTVPASQG
jgi:hypothetical protein